ncbi:MAG TPA: type II secretion system protein [Stenomitos sp.]
MPSGQQGFTLVEVLIAGAILLVVAVSSFSAFTGSSRLVQGSEQLSGVSNIERVAQSYLRNLDFGVLRTATESTVAAGIRAQLTAADWSRIGATGSLTVTRMDVEPKLVTLELRVSYGAGRASTSSVRVAQRGVNP